MKPWPRSRWVIELGREERGWLKPVINTSSVKDGGRKLRGRPGYVSKLSRVREGGREWITCLKKLPNLREVERMEGFWLVY